MVESLFWDMVGCSRLCEEHGRQLYASGGQLLTHTSYPLLQDPVSWPTIVVLSGDDKDPFNLLVGPIPNAQNSIHVNIMKDRHSLIRCRFQTCFFFLKMVEYAGNVKQFELRCDQSSRISSSPSLACGKKKNEEKVHPRI